MKADVKNMGPRIRELRRRRGLSQQKLADLVGVSRLSIHHYEKGERTIVAPMMTDIAKALGTDETWLLGGDSLVADCTNFELANIGEFYSAIHERAVERGIDVKAHRDKIWSIVEKLYRERDRGDVPRIDVASPRPSEEKMDELLDLVDTPREGVSLMGLR